MTFVERERGRERERESEGGFYELIRYSVCIHICYLTSCAVFLWLLNSVVNVLLSC